MKSTIGILLALGALGTGAYFTLRNGHGASLSGSRRRHNLRGPIEARELLLYCENDGDLYRQQVKPIEANLLKKLKKGVFDKEKSIKLWGYLADNCAKKYAKEFGSGQPWHKMFSTADRREVAKAFAESFISEHAG